MEATTTVRSSTVAGRVLHCGEVQPSSLQRGPSAGQCKCTCGVRAMTGCCAYDMEVGLIHSEYIVTALLVLVSTPVYLQRYLCCVEVRW